MLTKLLQLNNWTKCSVAEPSILSSKYVYSAREAQQSKTYGAEFKGMKGNSVF